MTHTRRRSFRGGVFLFPPKNLSFFHCIDLLILSSQPEMHRNEGTPALISMHPLITPTVLERLITTHSEISSYSDIEHV